MEHSNHPFRKENDLNPTSMIMFYVNLPGCIRYIYKFNMLKLGVKVDGDRRSPLTSSVAICKEPL